MRFALAGLLGLCLTLPAQEQDLAARLARVEAQLRALQAEREQAQLAGASLGELAVRPGLGPAGSKVYSTPGGVAFGGYGELNFAEIAGRVDQADAQRAVVFLGHRFDERWLVNTELEFEHGTTEASSGTTASGGSVSVEQAYLEYEASASFALRAGLVLVPLGLVNEQHEPTLFFATRRAQTETRIIPSTWRELGVGVLGEGAGFAWRGYLLTSLDGEEFGAAGLRSGRQKGNRAAADDLAGAVRLDFIGCEGLVVGGSVFSGRTGQDQVRSGIRIPAMHTTVADLHVAWDVGPCTLRSVAATAYVHDAGAFDRATGQRLARRMDGIYVEAACDVLAALGAESSHELAPFVRWEWIDTHADLPQGVARDRAQRDRIVTVGLDWKPRPEIVFKVDYEDWKADGDRFNLALGYVF